jgi:hypothetical protein
MTNTKDLIEQIAQRYGIRLSADDPMLMPYLLLESEANKVVEESRKLLRTVQQESTALFSRALTLLARELEFGAIVRQAKNDIEKIQRFYSFRIVIGVFFGVLSFVIGTVVGFFFIR